MCCFSANFFSYFSFIDTTLLMWTFFHLFSIEVTFSVNSCLISVTIWDTTSVSEVLTIFSVIVPSGLMILTIVSLVFCLRCVFSVRKEDIFFSFSAIRIWLSSVISLRGTGNYLRLLRCQTNRQCQMLRQFNSYPGIAAPLDVL